MRFPVVDVGVRAAGVADHLHAGVLHQRRGGVAAEFGVPDRVVDAESKGGHGAEPGAGVDGDGNGLFGGTGGAGDGEGRAAEERGGWRRRAGGATSWPDLSS